MKNTILSAIICCFALMVEVETSFALSSKNQGVPSYEALTESCQAYVEELKKDPSVTFGWIENIESSSQSDKKVRVFYQAKILKDEQGEIVNPVMFFNGGPGFDSHRV